MLGWQTQVLGCHQSSTVPMPSVSRRELAQGLDRRAGGSGQDPAQHFHYLQMPKATLPAGVSLGVSGGITWTS